MYRRVRTIQLRLHFRNPWKGLSCGDAGFLVAIVCQVNNFRTVVENFVPGFRITSLSVSFKSLEKMNEINCANKLV